MSPGPFDYPVVEMSAEEWAAERELYGGLAASVRHLADTSLRSTADAGTVRKAQELIEQATELLDQQAVDGAVGVQLTADGQVRSYGNAVVGLRNPVAVPLQIHQDHENGRASAEFELNALYEGPPTMVHGGVSALILDQLCGEAAAAGGHPGMTGTLTLRYRRPLPLGRCSAEARFVRLEGDIKAIVEAELRNADGEIAVEAEGVFILPRWAREAMAQKMAQHLPPQYE